MSQIVRCCACDERVRLPDVDSDVWVRCPLCREEFQLSRIATDLPPRLEVIGEPTLVVDSLTDDAESLTDGPGITAMPAIIDPQRPTAAGPDAPSPEGNLGATPNPNLHANRVKVRSNGNGLAFAKVAFGGVAGLILGQVILWWLPHPYRSDPFDLAKKVPTPLRFLLPPNEFDTIDSTLTTTSISPFEEIAVSSPLVENAMPGDSSREVAAVSNGPPVPPTDLRITLQTAVAEDTAFVERGSYQPRHVESWCEGLRQLSVCVSNIATLSSVNDEVVDEMKAFLERIAGDPRKVAALTSQAVRQMQAEEPIDQQGIVVAGEVLSIKPAGELYRTTLRLSETDRTVDVISRQHPTKAEACAEKDSVLILGVMLTTPTSLQGYKGTDQLVIFGGFPVNVDAIGTASP